MAKEKRSDQFTNEEAKQRFEQALRGARKADPKPLKEIQQKAKKKPAKKAG